MRPPSIGRCLGPSSGVQVSALAFDRLARHEVISAPAARQWHRPRRLADAVAHRLRQRHRLPVARRRFLAQLPGRQRRQRGGAPPHASSAPTAQRASCTSPRLRRARRFPMFRSTAARSARDWPSNTAAAAPRGSPTDADLDLGMPNMALSSHRRRSQASHFQSAQAPAREARDHRHRHPRPRRRTGRPAGR